ncbi:MAG: hypothetical protein DMF49_10830, partial [Acidobacteria bacterium]
MREIKRNGRPRWLGLALLLGAALVLWPGANARADDSALAALKESDDLEQQKAASATSVLLPVIVQTVQPPTTSDCYRVTSLGGTIKQTSYGLLNGYAAMVPAGQIDSLALGTEVAHVSPDRRVRSYLDVASLVAQGGSTSIGTTGL